MEAERARFALVKDTAALADQVEAVGPTGISGFDAIIKAVDQGGKLDAQFADACPGHDCAFCVVFRAAEEHAIAHVGLHLPNVSRMRLQDVNGVEPDFVPVLLGKFVQGGNLPPKGRSGIAPKDQHHWPIRPEIGQVGGSMIFKLFDGQGRRRIADA